ncbi:MAG: hypothetical protein AB7D06_08795 [Pedobacter sp.]
MTNPAATPQPMSRQGRQNVLPEVIKDLEARTAVGITKYGTQLQTHNGRDALIDAYQESLDQVQYLKQVLMERDNPAPEYNWPETIFVRQNTTAQQLDHILSEVDEINQIGPHIDPDGSPNDPILRHLHMKVADLHHSIETYWRKLEIERGPEYVSAVFQAVEDESRVRGYYDLDPIEEPLPCLAGPFGLMPQGV